MFFLSIQGLDADHLTIEHIQVNQAPNMRRRTYRAHGRINRKHFCVYFSYYTLKTIIKLLPHCTLKIFVKFMKPLNFIIA